MQTNLPTGCGNSPRTLIVGEFVTHWAAGNKNAVAQWLADDISWSLVGGDTHAGPGSADIATPEFAPDRLEILSIVTHGRLASCDGYIESGTKRVNFSHVFRFATTSKVAKIAELRTYCIDNFS